MNMNQKILELRKKAGLTQEQLAQKLNISFQAVSKWENAQACPDIGLVPQIADLFGVSIDELFGRAALALAAPSDGEAQPEGEAPQVERVAVRIINSLPWEDDDALHIVVYRGHRLMGDKEVTSLTAHGEEPLGVIRYTGKSLNVNCVLSLVCEQDVKGNATAGGSLSVSGAVGGKVASGGSANIGGSVLQGDVSVGGTANVHGEVGGNVSAGGSVKIETGGVRGSATAGGSVNVNGSVGQGARAGGTVSIQGEVSGNVEGGGGVRIDGDVTGNVTSKHSSVTCGDVTGSVTAGQNIHCKDIDGGAKVTAMGNISCDVLEDCTVECAGTVQQRGKKGRREGNDWASPTEAVKTAMRFVKNFMGTGEAGSDEDTEDTENGQHSGEEDDPAAQAGSAFGEEDAYEDGDADDEEDNLNLE